MIRPFARATAPAIAEEERPGVFTLRVGNLMPGDRATVELTMAGVLPYIDGEVTFRFPWWWPRAIFPAFRWTGRRSATEQPSIPTPSPTPRGSRRPCFCRASPTPCVSRWPSNSTTRACPLEMFASACTRRARIGIERRHSPDHPQARRSGWTATSSCASGWGARPCGPHSRSIPMPALAIAAKEPLR